MPSRTAPTKIHRDQLDCGRAYLNNGENGCGQRSQSEESGSQEAEGREETDHGGFDLPPSGATGHTVSRKAPNKLDKDTIIGVGKRVIGSVKEAVSNSLGPFSSLSSCSSSVLCHLAA